MWSWFMQTLRSDMFLPIINVTPSDTTCVRSTLEYISNHAKCHGVTPVIKLDQQLWWIAYNGHQITITWEFPTADSFGSRWLPHWDEVARYNLKLGVWIWIEGHQFPSLHRGECRSDAFGGSSCKSFVCPSPSWQCTQCHCYLTSVWCSSSQCCWRTEWTWMSTTKPQMQTHYIVEESTFRYRPGKGTIWGLKNGDGICTKLRTSWSLTEWTRPLPPHPYWRLSGATVQCNKNNCSCRKNGQLCSLACDHCMGNTCTNDQCTDSCGTND